jgi:hypothetical protein
MGQLVFQATAGGQVALVGPNPSTSFALNVPAINGNLITSGDTGTVTSTMLATSIYTAPGTIGSVTPNTGAFTTLSASSTVSGTGFSNYLASPPAIGGTTAAAGSFTNLAYTGTLTGGTGIVNLGSGQFYKDASGNVGIGNSSPSLPLSISKNGVNSGAGWYSISETLDASRNKGLVVGYDNSAQTTILLSNTTAASSNMAFWTYQSSGSGWAERMRIDSSGNLLVGGTAAASVGTTGGLVAVPNSGATYGLIGHTSGTASGSSYYYFFYNGNSIGSITQNGTTAVLYNTTSDYRLKSDVTPIKDALSTVEALNPVSFTWTDGRKDDGFLAHEIQAIIPNCVTGEKDAVNENGTPKYQQMDNSGVIPFLVKAIQEQQALITDLQTRLTKAGL